MARGALACVPETTVTSLPTVSVQTKPPKRQPAHASRVRSSLTHSAAHARRSRNAGCRGGVWLRPQTSADSGPLTCQWTGATTA